MEERPPSEISVLDDSPPGEEAEFPFQPKKELILFPGVFGWRGSTPMGMDRSFKSIYKGGGRLVGGCKAILEARRWVPVGGGEVRTGIKGSLTRRLCSEEGVPFVNWCA